MGRYVSGFIIRLNLLIYIFVLVPASIDNERDLMFDCMWLLLFTTTLLVYVLLKRLPK